MNNLYSGKKKNSNFLSNFLNYLLFAGPTTFAFIAVVIVPFIFGLFLTFTDYNGIKYTKGFVGFKNYISVFKDKEFTGLGNGFKGLMDGSFPRTIVYVVASVVLINVFAFGIAYILTHGIRGQNILRATFFTPNLIGGIILGFLWKFIFADILPQIGKTFHMGIFDKAWNASETYAIWTLVIATVWQYTGYMMILYIAGFMNVPKDVLEASSIDGATPSQTMRYIIIPLMIPSFITSIFLSTQRSFMVYDINLALTNGDPYRKSVLASMHVFQKAFTNADFGGGQAEALILFLAVALVTVSQTIIMKKREVEM